MQLLSVQSKLLWLLLPSLALAATPIAGDAIAVGSDQLNLVTPDETPQKTPRDALVGRVLHCRDNIPDPWGPDDPNYHQDLYTTRLNWTFPATPLIDKAFLESLGFVKDPEGEFAFDCMLELPGGIITFEIKGQIESDLRMAYRVYMGVFGFSWLIGQSDCSLLDVDEKPCVFTINTRYVKGQGRLFSQTDQKDPDLIDLCVYVEGSVKPPYPGSRTRSFKHEACFLKFHKENPGAAVTA